MWVRVWWTVCIFVCSISAHTECYKKEGFVQYRSIWCPPVNTCTSGNPPFLSTSWVLYSILFCSNKADCIIDSSRDYTSQQYVYFFFLFIQFFASNWLFMLQNYKLCEKWDDNFAIKWGSSSSSLKVLNSWKKCLVKNCSLFENDSDSYQRCEKCRNFLCWIFDVSINGYYLVKFSWWVLVLIYDNFLNLILRNFLRIFF